MDNSFLRLKDNIESAKDMQDSPTTTHYFLNPIQLLPDKSYLQITNFEGGISLDSDCEVFVVDCSDNVLADITNNVFIEEFVDSNGNNQCKIELINLGVDFYRETVLIKFKMLSSNAEWWTNPINITSYQSHLTVFFKYKNYDDFLGIGYTNANAWQSISLAMYFDIPLDESEVEDYFQISRNNTISARALIKLFERYKIEQINRFTFTRLNALLKHDLIYLDNIRVTNKPVVSSDDRQGDSNVFETELTVAKNYDDYSPYEFQLFGGLILSEFNPFGLYPIGYEITSLSANANIDITLETGTLDVYTSSGTLIHTFTEADMSIVSGNQLSVVSTGTPVQFLPSASYYVNLSSGTVSGLGLLNNAINDDTTWVFTIQQADYEGVSDYSSEDYFTGIAPSPIVTDLVLFYKFNEVAGTTATDSSTQGNDGTITNALINQTGLIDKCYAFNTDGFTDDYVVIPDSDSLSFGSGAFSIEVWLKPSADFGQIINKYNATSGLLEYQMFMQSGVIQFFIYTDASNRIGIADNVLMGTGAWQQVVVTYDGSGDASGMKMKIDNTVASFVPVETGTFTGMPNTSQDVYLGQQSDNLTGTNRYVGEMDILRIWKDHELTAGEITALYNSGNGTET